MVCKCYSLLDNYPIRICFILTKWYVNKNIIDTKKDSENSFILTKWYVNAYVYIIEISFKCRFILTKWYVNKSHRPPHDTIIIVLY